MKNYLITTPIYYVNDKPHIGHAYTSVVSDIFTRKLKETEDTFFLTGTDEHGQKIEKSAALKGVDTLEFCNGFSESFRRLSEDFNLSNNDFIRTTEERHKKGVQYFWNKLQQNDWIYKGYYKGWYAIRDEAFYSEEELVDGKAPTGAEVIWQEEESYFFKLSEFGALLEKLYGEIPSIVFPSSRLNEVKAFVKSGLSDLSISRTSFKWGIPVPNDEKHVIYVWLDALTNYITALGYPASENYQKFWLNAEKIHIIGKDILRFHAIFWPAFLIAEKYTLNEIRNLLQAENCEGNAADLTTSHLTDASGLRPHRTTPEIYNEIFTFFSSFKVVSHGWWKNNGEKMSKSLGNAINPYDLILKFGLDKVRYFFLREVPFGGDGDYSEERFISITNADLANNIGNLTQRVMSFIYNNCDGKIPKTNISQVGFESIKKEIEEDFKNYKFNDAILRILGVATSANEKMHHNAPWTLRKSGTQEDITKMNDILCELANSILFIYKMLAPIMPEASIKGLKIFDGENAMPSDIEILKMGRKEQNQFLEKLLKIEFLEGSKINKPEPIFIRL